MRRLLFAALLAVAACNKGTCPICPKNPGETPPGPIEPPPPPVLESATVQGKHMLAEITLKPGVKLPKAEVEKILKLGVSLHEKEK